MKSTKEARGVTDRGFLSFQLDYWDSPWQNRHAFLWELSKIAKVFFSSPPFYLPQLLDPNLPSRTNLKSGTVEIRDGLISHVPSRLLPYNYRFKRFDNLCMLLRDRRIRRMLKKNEIFDPSILVWHPFFAPMLNRFEHSQSVYYKYDNYSGYTDVGGSYVDKEEIALINKVDIFAVTSQGLKDLHRNHRDDIALIPNGVDYPFFAMQEDEPIPADMDSIPRPRIGYVGVINEKVDFGLLEFICRQRPDWSIVMVGPVKVATSDGQAALAKLEDSPNCYFLGQKEGRMVPPYMYGLDVAMMCYVINDWTYFGYPLKMHEYLACGKPVVSADLPAVREFKETVSIPGENHQDWIAEIEDLIRNAGDLERRRARQRTAEMNSWRCRVEQLLDLMES